MSELKVGDTVWLHDDNAGRYHSHKHDLTLAERYRLEFVEHEIVGETSRSWLVGLEHDPTKVSKKDFTYATWNTGRKRMFVSPAEVDDEVFRRAHRHKVAEVVGRLSDVKLLREVARLIGYEEGD